MALNIFASSLWFQCFPPSCLYSHSHEEHNRTAGPSSLVKWLMLSTKSDFSPLLKPKFDAIRDSLAWTETRFLYDPWLSHTGSFPAPAERLVKLNETLVFTISHLCQSEFSLE